MCTASWLSRSFDDRGSRIGKTPRKVAWRTSRRAEGGQLLALRPHFQGQCCPDHQKIGRARIIWRGVRPTTQWRPCAHSGHGSARRLTDTPGSGPCDWWQQPGAQSAPPPPCIRRGAGPRDRAGMQEPPLATPSWRDNDTTGKRSVLSWLTRMDHRMLARPSNPWRGVFRNDYLTKNKHTGRIAM